MLNVGHAHSHSPIHFVTVNINASTMHRTIKYQRIFYTPERTKPGRNRDITSTVLNDASRKHTYLLRAHLFDKVAYFCHEIATYPVSILYQSTAGRYRPVSYPDGPITARCRFIKNANWEAIAIIFLIFQKIKSFPENIIAII